MAVPRNPIVNATRKAIERWENEGGAPASGDSSTTKRKWQVARATVARTIAQVTSKKENPEENGG
jgi:hypothetical protein